MAMEGNAVRGSLKGFADEKKRFRNGEIFARAIEPFSICWRYANSVIP